MTDSQRIVLFADHGRGILPDAKSSLERRNYEVFKTNTIVETVTAIKKRNPELVVFCPSREPVPAFEFDTLLKSLTLRQALMLVLESNPDPGNESDPCLRADDYYVGRDAEELAIRVGIMSHRVKRMHDISNRLKRLREESITDYKTELFNDRFILRRLEEEFDRSKRHGLVLSVIMLDFDEFKEINDTLGHAFGDFVLLAFSKKLKSLIRKIDIPGRLGGDEFLLLLPNTDLDEAIPIAERIRTIVKGYNFERDGASAEVTVSIGINVYNGEGSVTSHEFLNGADKALLAAKAEGKNRIFLYPQLRKGETKLCLKFENGRPGRMVAP